MLKKSKPAKTLSIKYNTEYALESLLTLSLYIIMWEAQKVMALKYLAIS